MLASNREVMLIPLHCIVSTACMIFTPVLFEMCDAAPFTVLWFVLEFAFQSFVETSTPNSDVK